MQRLPWLFAYVALIALAVFGLVSTLAILREYKKSPFRRGVYVFPVGLIDARDAVLRVYAIEDLADVADPVGNRFTLRFGRAAFGFAVKGSSQAETAQAALASARGKVQDADAARDSIRPKALAALDPLQGFANPLVSSEPITRSAPTWVKRGWAIALAIGSVVGAAVWAVHNAKSDDAMYARAVASNDADSFRAYLARGSRHTTDVATVLLPRAELVAAVNVGSVTAIEAYAKDHPQTNIGPEVSAALKAALTKELAVAEQPGTLAAIDDFARRHPQSHLDAEIKAARHAVYQAALDRYTLQAPAKSTAELAFMQRLVAWAELKGLPSSFASTASSRRRSRRPTPRCRSIECSAEWSLSLPLLRCRAREAERVGARRLPRPALCAGVPDRDPRARGRRADHRRRRAAAGADYGPHPLLEHGPTWSGSVATAASPHGVFVGLEMSFSALFRVPDDTKPLKVRLDVWKGPDLASAKADDKPEETIYAKMQTDSFDQFQKKLLNAFFKPNK